MLEKLLIPHANKIVKLIGLGILPFVGNPRPHPVQRWVTWEYVDRQSSKTFLKFIAFFNVLLLLSFAGFFGDNFLSAIRSNSTSPLLLVFLIPLFAVLAVGSDTAKLLYYLHTSKIQR